ncbi:MAG: 16S rRNA (cytosine(1402)-N(4))-methyltransferase RsmH [Pseudomonadota bacterium]
MHDHHEPVLIEEMVRYAAPQDGDFVVDATFGRGGYSARLLQSAQCTVMAMDCDPAAAVCGQAFQERWGERFTFVGDRFSALAAHLDHPIDIIVFDLGLSSPQLADARRGFSFAADGPLDMRMSAAGPQAADVVNDMSHEEIADILHHYGQERWARRIARAIVRARQEQPITRTSQLAGLITKVIPHKHGRIHPATRVFMALRIYVNQELDELRDGLILAEKFLRPGGRLVVVCFHSLEDRIVKTFLCARSKQPAVSRFEPVPQPIPPRWEALTRRAVRPNDEEIAHNPRARSARLRAARRTAQEVLPTREIRL